jgi:hypothetical protein
VAKVQDNRFESAGWLFWAVGVAILVGPAVYIAYSIIIPGTSGRIIIALALGTTVSVLVSGVITASVNAFLQRAAQKRRATLKNVQRKKSKK